MSFTRWIIFASFTGGILALSLQPIGIANATKTSTILVANPHEGSSQDTGQDSPRSGKGGMSSAAESSGKMQSDKDAQPGGEQMGSGSKTIDQSRDQGGGESQGSSEKDPSGPLNLSNPGESKAATGADPR